MDDEARARNVDNNNNEDGVVVAPVADDRRDDDDEGSVQSESTAGTEEDPADVIPLDNEDMEDDEEDDEIVPVEDVVSFLSDRLPHFIDFYHDMIASIRRFSMPEVRRVAKLVAASCDKPVTSLSIDLHGNVHDLRVAKRVTKILRGLNLRELQEFKLEFREEDGNAVHPMKALIVDHYLTFLLLNVTSVERLTDVTVPFLGTNDVVWSSFLERFTSIDRLGMSVHWRGSGTASRLNTSGIIRRLRQLPSLPRLSLDLNVRKASICTSTLFHAVSRLDGLRSLDVDVDQDGEVLSDVDAAINGVHGIVALSTSLRWLRVRVLRVTPPPGTIIFVPIMDWCNVLESALHSTSIKDLRLEGMTFETSRIGAEEAIANESVKSIVLRNCSIEASGWSLIRRFRGLESLELDGVGNGFYDKAWSEMLTALPRLSSFTDTGYLRRHCRDKSLTHFVSHVACAPALANLRLSTAAGDRGQGQSRLLPSLSTLMQHVKGTLELRHTDSPNDTQASDSNLGYISSGIELSRDLRTLHLLVPRSSLTSASVNALLTVLQCHQSIEAFNGYFCVTSAAPWDPHCLDDALFNLISMNASLQSFGLRVYVTDGQGRNRWQGGEKMIRRTMYRGLEHNRTLKVLSLSQYSSGEDETRVLVAALQRNATLERIKFHYRSALPDSVEWLLTLNRYKRRLLVNPSAVPRGCWLSVFELIVKDKRSDVLYHFSRKLLPLLQQQRKARSGVKRASTSEIEDVH